MSEEAIYGLILVSGMIVAAGQHGGSSVAVLITVLVTVVVFYLAHVYAGALGRLALSEGRAGFWRSAGAASRQSLGMLVAAIPAIIVLTLGASRIIDDTLANWAALSVNTVVLGIFGWIAVARWTKHWMWRLVSALVTAAFGGLLIILKALLHH